MPVIAEKMTAEQCCERLYEDHRTTEKALVILEQKIHQGSWHEAFDLFLEIDGELDRHFACEEHALFPVLNLYRPMFLMEVEHDDLIKSRRDVYDVLQQAARTGETSANVTPLFQQLKERLQAHIKEEDEGIFRLTEELLEPEEQALVKRKISDFYEAIPTADLARHVLTRPEPVFEIGDAALHTHTKRPIEFAHLFEKEHASLQRMVLKAGQKLKPHWAIQHTCLILITGRMTFKHEHELHEVSAGQFITMDPKLMHEVEALEDTLILAFKVWPRPYFLRVEDKKNANKSY